MIKRGIYSSLKISNFNLSFEILIFQRTFRSNSPSPFIDTISLEKWSHFGLFNWWSFREDKKIGGGGQEENGEGLRFSFFSYKQKQRRWKMGMHSVSQSGFNPQN